MAKLIYVANVSLDGCIDDAHGGFEWTEPTDEIFTFITDLVRPVGAYLYGRRMHAFNAGLVDECHLFTCPVLVGRGKPAFPDARAQLELLEEYRFGKGVVYLRYRSQS